MAAAVLGGLTSIPGAVLGGLILGVAEPLAGGYMHSSIQELWPSLSSCSVLIFLPTGLLGARGVRKCNGASACAMFLLPLAIGALVPAFANHYTLFVGNLMLLYIILALGLNILVGFAGTARLRQRGHLRHRRLWNGAAPGASWLVVLGGGAGGARDGHGRRHAARVPRPAAQRHLPGTCDARVRASDAVGVVALAIGDLRCRRLRDPPLSVGCRSIKTVRHLLRQLAVLVVVLHFPWRHVVPRASAAPSSPCATARSPRSRSVSIS